MSEEDAKRASRAGPNADEIGDDLDPWERQPGESEEAFVAFATYRDLESPRSLREVAKACEKDPSLIGRWSSRYDWIVRVAAWDRQRDEARRNADLKARAEMGRRHGEHAMKLQEALMKPAEAIAKRWAEAAVDGKDPFEGINNLELINAAVRAARVYAQIGVFERLTRGLSTSNVGGHDGGAIKTESEIRERVEKMPRGEQEDYLLGLEDGRRRAESHGLPSPPESLQS